ncbi:S ribonuclease [Pyrus ussuriensis x Pyrus communis]|uniref:S ribonuclease n=1 Tax=Pyrus ussuriensis x Pyrus communis TaxID=2448454 RepID=A0A5N5IAC1_9ROSA|nr:S ribonuclease [Pyrus ussuriensis x Pyrus communis]
MVKGFTIERAVSDITELRGGGGPRQLQAAEEDEGPRSDGLMVVRQASRWDPGLHRVGFKSGCDRQVVIQVDGRFIASRPSKACSCIVWYAEATGRNRMKRDRTERNGMGRDRTERNRAGAKMLSDGNKEKEEGDGEVIILCSTDVERVVPGGEVE